MVTEENRRLLEQRTEMPKLPLVSAELTELSHLLGPELQLRGLWRLGSRIQMASSEFQEGAVIQGFGRELGLSLVTAPDARRAEPFVTPRLVHGDALQILDFTSDSVSPQLRRDGLSHGHSEEVIRVCSSDADALMVMTHHELARVPSPLVAPRELGVSALRVGMRTADCLVWVCVFRSASRTFVSFAHLGWRSLAAGLLWRVADELFQRAEGEGDSGEAWATASHYLSPCIFGQDYPCGNDDVGEALRELATRAGEGRSSLSVQEGARRRQELFEAGELDRFIGRSGSKCFPELQQLALIDLLCLGARSERIVVHRVNTARSPVYPSHRYREAKGFADGRLRLATLCLWDPA